MNRSRVFGIFAAATGLGLVGWILVDASSVAATLRLSGVMDEAAVALIGLTIAGVCFAAAAALLRRPEVDAHVR